RGDVGRAAAAGDPAGAGGDVDDVAATARLHAPGGVLRGQDDRREVDVDDPARRRVLLGLEGPDRHDRRDVDEDVERPETALDLVQERAVGLGVGDVDGATDDLAADLRHDLVDLRRL